MRKSPSLLFFNQRVAHAAQLYEKPLETHLLDCVVNMENMNDYAVGIDIGEKESVATHMSPSGDIIGEFTFPMNSEGYRKFREKIPSETRIAFEPQEWLTWCSTVSSPGIR